MDTEYPLHVFNFEVEFVETNLLPEQGGGGAVPVCKGAFAECTGLEATMEPKVIKSGGANFGHAQRAGQVSFATVVLKRGMTSTRDLWKWFDMCTRGSAYAHRMSVSIRMRDAQGKPVVSWHLDKAMPVKFKAADLNAKGSDIGIEELHLAHEGLTLLS